MLGGTRHPVANCAQILRGELDRGGPKFSFERWSFVVPGIGTITVA
jgi:hypothetical protein